MNSVSPYLWTAALLACAGLGCDSIEQPGGNPPPATGKSDSPASESALVAGVYRQVQHPTACLQQISADAPAAGAHEVTIDLQCGSGGGSNGTLPVFSCDGLTCTGFGIQRLEITGPESYTWTDSRGKVFDYVWIGPPENWSWSRELPAGAIAAVFSGPMQCSFNGGTEVQYISGQVVGEGTQSLVVDWGLDSAVVDPQTGTFTEGWTVAGHEQVMSGVIDALEITMWQRHQHGDNVELSCSGRFELHLD